MPQVQVALRAMAQGKTVRANDVMAYITTGDSQSSESAAKRAYAPQDVTKPGSELKPGKALFLTPFSNYYLPSAYQKSRLVSSSILPTSLFKYMFPTFPKYYTTNMERGGRFFSFSSRYRMVPVQADLPARRAAVRAHCRHRPHAPGRLPRPRHAPLPEQQRQRRRR